mgnify:CR=1 FL=1
MAEAIDIRELNERIETPERVCDKPDGGNESGNRRSKTSYRIFIDWVAF